MINDDYTKEYFEIVKSGDYYEDFQRFEEKKSHSRAGYAGKPIPAKYQGLFYDERHRKDFQKISDIMMSITDKVTQAYLCNEAYRKLFPFPKVLEEMILVDPGYDVPAPMARYDLFYDGSDRFVFCELNTDGSSAMNEDNLIGNLLLETEAMQEFQKRHSVTCVDLFDSWVEESTKLYKKYHANTPTVAIVDCLEHGVINEFELFRDCYEKHGVPCVIADLRALTLRDDGLYFEDTKIDMIYRRFVTSDYLNVFEDCRDFTTAYKNGQVMMLGSFRSHLMHNKYIFKVLRDPLTKDILSDMENDFVEQHIPLTLPLTDESKEEILKDKDRWIIKPIDGYASHGVYCGRDYTKKEFAKLIDECIPEHYIYQEYFLPPKLPFVSFDENNKPYLEDYGVVIGMFIYNKQFVAPYTRIGKSHIISGAREYFVAPNLLVL